MFMVVLLRRRTSHYNYVFALCGRKDNSCMLKINSQNMEACNAHQVIDFLGDGCDVTELQSSWNLSTILQT